MALEERLQLTKLFAFVAAVTPDELEKFRRHIDSDWIEEALQATGTATVRRRRLPAELVLWLVVGMALMRNESIERVAAMLDIALPAPGRPLVAKSAIAQARQRLGEDPVAYLFVLTAAEWAHRSADRYRWRGLALYGADGTTLRVADSPENWAEFGGQPPGARNGSAYPTVRLVALMALRSHVLAAVRFGSFGTGETTLARELWRETPDDSLTIVDRGLFVFEELYALEKHGRNRHWLARLRKRAGQIHKVTHLGPNDWLIDLEISRKTRSVSPELPQFLRLRLISYQRKGFRPSALLTTLLDPALYPATEIVGLYHERWELEIGYDEVKTHLLAREETIRSRTPQGVRQEIWGVALAYNLVRVEMERAAEEAGVQPTRISFVNALALIRNAWLSWSMPPLAPGRIPEGILDLQRHMALLLLPERRDRTYPRAVKIKMSGYARKPPSGRGRK